MRYIPVIEFSDVEREQLDCDCDVVACDYTLFKSSMSATPITETEAAFKLATWKTRDT